MLALPMTSSERNVVTRKPTQFCLHNLMGFRDQNKQWNFSLTRVVYPQLNLFLSQHTTQFYL